ncbi:MAG: hypothetical protein ACYDCK_12515 [Thermoplasmatota archaeon]
MVMRAAFCVMALLLVAGCVQTGSESIPRTYPGYQPLGQSKILIRLPLGVASFNLAPNSCNDTILTVELDGAWNGTVNASIVLVEATGPHIENGSVSPDHVRVTNWVQGTVHLRTCAAGNEVGRGNISFTAFQTESPSETFTSEVPYFVGT